MELPAAPSAPVAPILIIQHRKENPRKCTVTALRGRPDVEVLVLRPGLSGYEPLEIEGGILLAVDSPPLSPADRGLIAPGTGGRLVLVDANWVKIPPMLRCLRSRGPLAHRSLPADVRTAYPRRSKVFEDPAGGLATVEALAAALAILGIPDPTLLAGYVWRDRFLELNRGLFGPEGRVSPVAAK
jgi:rRNA small subunit aminocarboxypropyltransferase